MIWIYRLLFLPIFIVVFPFYLKRMIKRGGYARDFSHRFGNFPKLPAKRKGVPRIWIQAVSVGEIQAVEPLLRRLAAEKNREVVLTTTTSTAYKILREKYAPLILQGGVFPIDFCPFSRRTWNAVNPDVAVLMEGELWPEHLHQAKRRGVPVLLINARLSDRSYARYLMVPRLAKRLFSHFSRVLASSDEDAARFAALGVAKDRIEVTGNLKFDVACEPRLTPEQCAQWHRKLGFGDGNKVLIGASTWPGEEAMLLELFDALARTDEAWRLLIVPRHAERRAEIIALLRGQTRPWIARSQTPDAPHAVSICLADTTGELRALMQCVDLAFIGKSLPPNDGGQTPIEAAVFGVPMVYGPNMRNFRPVCASLERAGAAVRAVDAADARARLLALAADDARRADLSRAAQAWHAANRGAADRTMAALSALCEACRGTDA